MKTTVSTNAGATPTGVSRRARRLAAGALGAAAAVALLAATAPQAHAAISATSANVNVVAAPATAPSAGVTSATNLFVWYEGRATVAGSPVDDVAVGGLTVNGVGPPTTGPGGSLTGEFESYMLWFDPPAATTQGPFSVSFNRQIEGVIYDPTLMNSSDATWNSVGTTYPGTRQIGPGDMFTISADRYTITINQFATGLGTDQLRVLINPEPGTWALFGLGALGLAGMVRRRRRLRVATADAADSDSVVDAQES